MVEIRGSPVFTARHASPTPFSIPHQGFEEMPTNNYVESSFWNFDALFQPQQHPARDAHDTFFLTRPATSSQAGPKENLGMWGARFSHWTGSDSSAGSASAPAETLLPPAARGSRWMPNPRPCSRSQFPEDYQRRVKETHEKGGFGSAGYNYNWKASERERPGVRLGRNTCLPLALSLCSCPCLYPSAPVPLLLPLPLPLRASAFVKYRV